MDNNAIKEVLNELFSHLERLETQSEAILQLLKEKKRVTDRQLAPYLEQAGNAANVKWRAARVRIDHLLSPEHPEEELKLGKRPEVHEDSSTAAGSSEGKRSEPTDQKEKRRESDAKQDKRLKSAEEESKGTESGNQKQIESSDKKTESKNVEMSGTDLSKKEKPAPVEAMQARSADGKKDKPEEKSESKPRNAEHPTQDQREQKSDSDDLHHPTEATESLAEQEGAEPPAQLKPDKTDSGKEAA